MLHHGQWTGNHESLSKQERQWWDSSKVEWTQWAHIQEHWSCGRAQNHSKWLKTSLENRQKEIDEFRDKLKSSEGHIISIQKQVVGLNAKCNQLQQANIRITDHLTNIEAQSRRNNLLMDCVPESQGESNDKCKAVLLDILDDIMKVENVRNFQIVRYHRLGRYSPKSPRPCPFIFKLQWFGHREAIWLNVELKDHPYWIQKDFPSVIVERCCALAPIVKAAREQGKKALLLKSFYHIPLTHDWMKYRGVITPFKGVRVYTQCAMGMPGLEMCLKKMISLVLGDLIMSRSVIKITDDLYCGGDDVDETISD